MARCRVGLLGQLVDDPEELRRLALEQAIRGEAGDRGDRAAEPIESRTHDRDGRKPWEELGGLGQNQVGLIELAALGVQVGVGDPGDRVGDAASGCATAFPALSCQSEKWLVSTPPIATMMRRTSRCEALSAMTL